MKYAFFVSLDKINGIFIPKIWIFSTSQIFYSNDLFIVYKSLNKTKYFQQGYLKNVIVLKSMALLSPLKTPSKIYNRPYLRILSLFFETK